MTTNRKEIEDPAITWSCNNTNRTGLCLVIGDAAKTSAVHTTRGAQDAYAGAIAASKLLSGPITETNLNLFRQEIYALANATEIIFWNILKKYIINQEKNNTQTVEVAEDKFSKSVDIYNEIKNGHYSEAINIFKQNLSEFHLVNNALQCAKCYKMLAICYANSKEPDYSNATLCCNLAIAICKNIKITGNDYGSVKVVIFEVKKLLKKIQNKIKHTTLIGFSYLDAATAK